jgi:probable HAF family extracellular repeat protein
MRVHLHAAVAALVLLLASWAAAQEAAYTVVDLGVLPGSDLPQAHGLNDAGEVVGGGGLLDDHAFLWLPRPRYGLPAGIHDLGTLGGTHATAHDIDPFGRIVGFSTTADPNSFIGRPFLWQDGAMTDLGVLPPDPGGVAGAINRHGEVVGSGGDGFACRPLIWLPEPRYGLPAGINPLPLTGGLFEGIAFDINDRGEVVGRLAALCDAIFIDHPYLWLPAPAYGLPAGPHDLMPGAPSGTFAVAEAINELGEIVGWSNDSFGTDSEPFLWRDGVFEPLPLPPAIVSATAADINDLGQVVGSGDDGMFPSPPRALLWSDGEVHDLNDLIPPGSGWVLETAVAINRRGEIAGNGRHDGARRVFLLTPLGGVSPLEIPVLDGAGLALLALLVAGAGAILLARRRPAPRSS